jgi:GMP synthase-like glutamine amidotransferase
VLAQDRVRLIGVCFGHQIVGRALGAKVGRSDGGWEVAVNDIELTEKGKELFGVDKLVRFFPPSQVHVEQDIMANCICLFFKRLQQMHRDDVHSCPSNVTLLGSSPACPVQGLYVPRRFITVQGHPEFTDEIMFELLETRKYMGVFPEGVYEGGIKRFANEHDGSAVSQAFIKFLLEE